MNVLAADHDNLVSHFLFEQSQVSCHRSLKLSIVQNGPKCPSLNRNILIFCNSQKSKVLVKKFMKTLLILNKIVYCLLPIKRIIYMLLHCELYAINFGRFKQKSYIVINRKSLNVHMVP